VRIGDISSRPTYPPRDGAGIRTNNLLRYLSSDHEVRQYASARKLFRKPSVDVCASSTVPLYVCNVNSSLVSGLASAVGSRAWHGNVFAGVDLPISRPKALSRILEWADVVLVEQPWQFAYCRRLRPKRPLVLAAHNVELQTRTSHAEAACVRVGPKSAILRWVRRVEGRAVGDADLIVAVSESDRQGFVDCYGVPPERIAVVENGTDTERFVPVAPNQKVAIRARLGLPDGPIVIFMAAHSKAPDVAALQWVRRVAARMPECTFVVTGGILRPASEGNFLATGWVEDVAPYLQAADLALCPVAHGGGTKLKLFDSLAVGLPVIAFAETLHGTALRDGEELLVSEPELTAVVRSLRAVLEDPFLATRLGTAARRFVVRRHDWERSAVQLEGVLVELVEGQMASARRSRRVHGQSIPAA